MSHTTTFSRRGRVVVALLGLASLLAATVRVQAQAFKTLLPLSTADGYVPSSALIRDSQGNLYGTTPFGGLYGYGTVFKLDMAGNITILHNFAGPRLDGGRPYSDLFRDAQGNLYGTTIMGGVSNMGVIFKIDPQGFESLLHHFFGRTDGAHPLEGLVEDRQGNLYGTTANGGAFNAGIVYKLDAAGVYSIVYTFTRGADGGFPNALTLDSQGTLYGTTTIGGLSNAGVIFKLDPAGHESVLYSFTGGADGASPVGSLARDENGALYGTTTYGGLPSAPYASGAGVIFKLDKKGHYRVLYRFTGGADGAEPYAGPTLDEDGILYGTTLAGGTYNGGVVFQLNKRGRYRVLHAFTGGPDGGNPEGALALDEEGILYGTTAAGGTYNGGVVFELTSE